MPPSQLKQLKASLRDSGVIRPQQSKKQKRQNAKSGVSAQDRNKRNAALQAIRDRFNPFEIKAPSNRSKFDATTRDGSSTSKERSRPGVTKSLGEERRRATLLQEMNSRNKVGGLVDRRFGENDPTMTPEERAAERFARESQRKMRKESMFNLEDEEDEFQLTHLGQSLDFDGASQDDFEAGDLDGLASDEESPRKRKRFLGDDGEDADFVDNDEDENQPDRKKSKAEVMKEVIAKSKFYKHERQKAKEDDEDLRDELDQELPDLFEALRGMKAPAKPEPAKQDLETMNPARAAMLQEPENQDAEKEYDQRLKQLTFDKRSQPTDRTKTQEEKAEEEAERLKKLEEDRVRRMRGEQLSDEEEEDDKDSFFQGEEEEEDIDDAQMFGLPSNSYESRPEMDVEDEDDFLIDDDLVETRSNVSLSLNGSDIEEEELSDDDEPSEPDDEDELINGLSLPTSSIAGAASIAVEGDQSADGKLAFTYPCPVDHEGFLEIIKDVPTQDVPTVIQRIRALHHPRLHPSNKAKLGSFAEILVEHVSYLGNESEQPSFAVIESILRHIHSLAKTHTLNVATSFRARLRDMSNNRPLNLLPGDLIILTGISTVFPTSDHFHAVSTPAHLCLGRYLGQSTASKLSDVVTGAFATSLILQYQSVSKRYMPEFINYTLNALCNLAPTKPSTDLGFFPFRECQSLRLAPSKKVIPRKLQFRDITAPAPTSQAEEDLKISIVTTFISLIDSAASLWSDQSAFTEIFTPARAVLDHLRQSFTSKSKGFGAAQDLVQSTIDKIDTHLTQARLARRPLELHHHRPLAIKSAIPKFEENFNPDKHYDPDRERAEANRLKAEYKRERKGAMRELRNDASFVAREKLREKKERDAEYEKKYKRLVAEIQNEEGRAANDYERERRSRQGKR